MYFSGICKLFCSQRRMHTAPGLSPVFSFLYPDMKEAGGMCFKGHSNFVAGVCVCVLAVLFTPDFILVGLRPRGKI